MTVNFNPVRPHPGNYFLLCLLASIIVGTFTSLPKSQAQTLQDPDFAAAMAQINNQRWQQAEALLTSMLSQNPDLHRARLELGRVYLKLNEPQKAKTEFSILLQHPAVPDRVKQNIQQLLQQLPPQTNFPKTNPPQNTTQQASPPGKEATSDSHKFAGIFQFSLGFDDNVRYSAADYFIEDDPFLNGVFVDFDDGSFVFVAPDGFVYDEEGNQLFENDGFLDLGDPDRENGFAEARLELEHSYGFSDATGLEWKNQVSLQTTRNQQLSQYDRLQLRLESGLSWQFSQHWKLDVATHYRRLERDGKIQVKALGLAPELTYYNHLGSWSFGFQWLRRKYEDSLYITGELETIYEGFDNNITSVSGKWSNLFLDNKLLLLAKFEYSDSNASDDFDYKGQRFTLAGVYKINDSWTLLLSAEDFHQDYSESAGGPLDDDISTFRSRLTWQFKDSLQLFLAGERAIRTSDIYGGLKTDKSLIQAGVELNF